MNISDVYYQAFIVLREAAPSNLQIRADQSLIDGFEKAVEQTGIDQSTLPGQGQGYIFLKENIDLDKP